MHDWQCTSPIDGSVVASGTHATAGEIGAALARARTAQADWRRRPLAERVAACARFVEAVLAQESAIAEELCWQIGRPIRQAPGELRGYAERATAMLALAPEALDELVPAPLPGYSRRIRREPLGTVFLLAPWNYPWLTTVNTLIPALAAGNAVLLKPSAQTPLVAERLAAAARQAGLPEGLFQHLYLSHGQSRDVLAAGDIQAVAFTGSVAGGLAVQDALRGRFLPAGLELGGCDPAYVRADADLAQAADSVVDGAMYNAGQSCCGLQRIYVHAAVYDEFLERASALLAAYALGDPRRPETTLGPVVRASAAEAVRAAANQALALGARDLVPPGHFPADAPGTAYVAPRLLAGAHHGMSLMREECFGPIAGIQAVNSDAEALSLMNDNRYGLSAALYTRDAEAAGRLAGELDCGSVFLNRCDYLDPYLAWSGRKDSGRGCTLSRLGYEQLTRPKSFHFRTGP